MTKRYEKFEEWMVGKTVRDDGGDKGVVTREYEDCDSCVWAEWEDFGEAWIDVGSLVFLDVDEGHEPEQENKPIPWQVGQVVFCILRGKGVVSRITESEDYPLEVDFFDTFDRYTLDGKSYTDHKGRVLFFSEPKIEAELFPPKKKFVPTLKKGDVIAYRQRGTSFTGVGTVEWEDEDSVAIEEDEVAMMRKCAFEFYKIGEEVKWD